MRAAFDALREQLEPTSESPSRKPGPISGVRALSLPVVEGPLLRGMEITPEPPLESFQVEFAHDTQFFSGLSHDLACGGVFVATYRELPVGTAVRLDFELPGGVRIEARGAVRWIRQQDEPMARRGMAIAFTEISEEALRGIAGFCRLHPPLFLDLED